MTVKRFFAKLLLVLWMTVPCLAAFAADIDGDGYDGSVMTWARDCDDSNPTVHPDSLERCNGVDDDCDGHADFTNNGMIDGGTSGSYDRDGDGSTESSVWWACPMTPVATTLVPTSTWNNVDCNDGNAGIYPGAPEVCDGVDNNCDSLVDAADRWLDAGKTRSSSLGGATGWRDSDGDTYGSSRELTLCPTTNLRLATRSGDCNDRLSTVRPGAPEVCDRKDNDCDHAIDAADNNWRRTSTDASYRLDADSDTWWSNASIAWCSATPLPSGARWADQVSNRLDCNDSNADINPRAADMCDGVDNDCDGATDDADSDQQWLATAHYYLINLTDGDGDDYFTGDFLPRCTSPSGTENVLWAQTDLWDCDDSDPNRTHICSPPDRDGDGYSTDEDCDDGDPGINPGSPEVNDDFIDSDCDGSPWYGGQWTTYTGFAMNWAYNDVLKLAPVEIADWSLSGANPPRPTSGSAAYPGPEFIAGVSYPWVLIPGTSGGRRLQTELGVLTGPERTGGGVVITLYNAGTRTALVNATLRGVVLDFAQQSALTTLALAAKEHVTITVQLDTGTSALQLWDSGGATGTVRLVGAGIAGTY